MERYFIAGGAGFIGSHLVKNILSEEKDAEVIAYDNFSSGKMQHLDEVRSRNNLKIVEGDIKDRDALVEATAGIDIVYHLASNPDISKAITQPDIDFWEGTYLTNNVLEAIRINNIRNLIYASGSGVYGDAGLLELDEDYPFKLPVSTYGASKLASEAMICAYCHMFDINNVSLRLANVVGPNQTHGVGYDFVKKLMSNPKELLILGGGKQSKSYIYIDDVISAMRLIEKNMTKGFSYYNVATLDYLEVKEIADIVVEIMRLENVKYSYADGDRGWKGDVPIVRMDSKKLRKLGWSNKYTSKEAIYTSVESMLLNLKSERI